MDYYIHRKYDSYISKIILAFVIILIMASVVKNFYYPPIHCDTIFGYSLYAKAIVHQMTFNPVVSQVTHRFYYPPLVALNIAACNIIGVNEKLPNSLYFILLLVVFYIITKKHTSELIASLATLLLCLTPELYYHSALSLTNLPAATFIGLGFLFMYDKQYKWSTLFYALAGFTRSESVLFIGVATLFIFFTDRKALKIHLLAYVPFITWWLYLQYIGISMNKFTLDINWQRIGYMWQVISSVSLYGITFYLIAMSLILHCRNKVTLYIVSTFVLFVVLYLFMDHVKMGCEEVKLISAGFKRGLFYFIPTGVFNVATALSSMR